VTFTATPTPTNSPTPIQFPYILVIEAYNEAGELVKLIGESRINENISGFDTLVSGNPVTVFNPSDPSGQLVLRFPGIWTPEQKNVDYVDFTWAGLNENGQPINQGVYYIKVSVKDNYGHVETTVKDIQVLKTEQYTRVSIYNTAGEVIRVLESPVVSGTVLNLDSMEDVMYVDNGGSVAIKFGAPGQLEWDGKNMEGKMVSNGIYEIRVEIKTADGYTVSGVKTVTVLSQRGSSILVDESNPLAYPKSYPNPVYAYTGGGEYASIDWFSAVPGEITIKIYNMAGELVRRIEGNLAVKPVKWDLRTTGGQDACSGLYVAVLYAKAKDGRRDIASVKISLIRKGDPQATY